MDGCFSVGRSLWTQISTKPQTVDGHHSDLLSSVRGLVLWTRPPVRANGTLRYSSCIQAVSFTFTCNAVCARVGEGGREGGREREREREYLLLLLGPQNLSLAMLILKSLWPENTLFSAPRVKEGAVS